jgi:biopolymer transport protein ExbD/DNA-directed RNA polymerase subunit RPC12/RpoP
MKIRFHCSECGKPLSAQANAAGQRRKCPNCGTKVLVPAADSPAALRAKADSEQPSDDHPMLLVPSRREDHRDLIDMTAMVDIVFFLLIFFLVTSMESLEAVINLPSPQASESASSSVQTVPDYANDPDYVVVTIDADDAVFVEDEEAMSEQDLRAKLRLALRQDDRKGMLIKGAGNSTHGKFVMVLDAGADAGVQELLFSVDANESSEGG